MTREELLQLFDDTTAHCRATMVKKNTDYCAGEANAAVDPFANFRISECVGVNPVLGLMMRMMDKMQRVRAFVADGKLAVAEETVDDAFDDMVNYAILGKGLMRDMRATKRQDLVGMPYEELPADVITRRLQERASLRDAGYAGLAPTETPDKHY